ncbi:nicotinate phosphoribosyltransferase [Acanthamoeba castellanii str. Neff]|uniref:Nicotinate phosphoribosyltransferase n=1 Tax=Acanthamoeba castellanii (strain ATCC 30010 / Neff) TaxID=1257118 RepID=L8HHA8_ACACF|nr:nicotinate phosphoribosyltransferase [Acanthamoeba castellanii str. Neff]ELR24555.1 nicotinate phosphoribosyltransferase [Acanthamoeba castellanii str. Neff]
MAQQNETRDAGVAALRLGVVGTGDPSVTDFLPTNSLVVPLLTDLYELTMAYAYWKAGKHEEHAVFDLFFRKNPFKGEVTIFAGLEEVLRYVKNLRFTKGQIDELRAKALRHCREDGFYEWLATVDSSKLKIYAVPEGTLMFPRVPLIRVEGPLAVAQLLETTLLTLVNYPRSVTLITAAGLMEFGLRRAQGPDGGVYSYMGGFDSTSNVLTGLLWDIETQGTHAHSFVESFFDDVPLSVKHLKKKGGEEEDFEKAAMECREELGFSNTSTGELRSFISYAIAFPTSCVCLVDTYDTMNSGVPNFLCVAYALHKFGYKAAGIRLDSGDLAYLSKQARKLFAKTADRLGLAYFKKFQIVASSEISEDVLYSLNQQGHEIDVFGVGTNLVTCQKQPALGCVYKLVELNGENRIKLSEAIEKVTIPGRKLAYRLYGKKGGPVIDVMLQLPPPGKGNSADNDVAKGDTPAEHKRILCCDPFDGKKRAYITPTKVEKLHQLYFSDGKVVQELPHIGHIRAHILDQIANLRPDHLRPLNPTPYKVSVTETVFRDFHRLWEQSVPIKDISNLNVEVDE